MPEFPLNRQTPVRGKVNLFTVATEPPELEGLEEQEKRALIEAARARPEIGRDLGGSGMQFPDLSADPEQHLPVHLRKSWKEAHKKGMAERDLKQSLIRQRAWSLICRCIESGMMVKDALEVADVPTRRHEGWLGRYPEYRAAINKAKAKKKHLKRLDQTELPFALLRKKLFGRDTYPFQQTMIDIIDNAPDGEITMILLPPSVGKTMTLEDYLSIEFGRNHKLRVLYTSETDQLGTNVASVLKARMENEDGEFDAYVNMFGPFYEPTSKQKWQASRFEILGSDCGQRDYSFTSRGFNSQVYSMRADIIIFDDVQTQNTLNQTEKMLAKLRGTFLTRREGGFKGKVIYVGTMIGLDDLPTAMIKERLVLPENLFVMPLLAPDGTSNFEEVIPTSTIPTIIRQQGPQFPIVYQMDTTKSGTVTFTDAIDKIKSSYTIMDWYSHLPHEDIICSITTIDPALEGGNAVMAMSASMTDIWVHDLDLQYDVGKLSKIETVLEQFILQYMSSYLVVESKAFQKALLTSDTLEEMADAYGFTIVPHTTSDNKKDPNFGVASMERMMNAGRLHIPYGDKHSQTIMQPLIHQLQTWRPDIPTRLLEQDTVMALWFGVFWIQQYRRMLRQQNQHQARQHRRKRRDRVPGGKTAYRRIR